MRGSVFGIPGVHAFARDQIEHRAVDLLRLHHLSAIPAEEDGNGHAPHPLPRDAPVGPRGDHVGDALFAPLRVPLHFLDLVERGLAQGAAVGGDLGFHRDEPLLGGAEDHRTMAAPAVRIRVLQSLFVHERAATAQQLDDRGIRLEDSLAVVLGQAVAHDAGFVHVGGGIELVALAGIEVIGAVRGRSVDRACALVHGDVIGEHAQHLAIRPRQKRMIEVRVLEHTARNAGDGLRDFESAMLRGRLGKFFGDDVHAVGRLKRDVFFFRMKGDGQRRRQRPGRGGPDDDVDWLPVESNYIHALTDMVENVFQIFGRAKLVMSAELISQFRRRPSHPILHPDAGAGVQLVLDFGFGQRRFVVDAPVHRTQALVHRVFFEEGVERLEHHRLVLGRHGGIRTVEAPEDADALELLALQVEILLGIAAAGLAHLDGRHLQLLAAQRFVDFDFDGQAVAVPAGDVGRVVAQHGARLDDKVFQALVERVAEVDGPVGVGRPVVQNPDGRAFAGLPDAVIDTQLLPAREHFGLVLRQVGLHRKIGFRQVQRRFQVQRRPHSVSSVSL